MFCCAPSRPNTTKNNCVVFVPCPASGTLVPPQPIGNKTRHNPPHTTKHNWVIFVPCLASGTLVPPQPTKHNKEQLYHFCALPCLGNPSTPTTHRKQNSPQPTKHNDVQLCRFCALPCHPGPPTTHQTQRGTTVSFCSLPCLGHPSPPTTHQKQNSHNPSNTTKHNCVLFGLSGAPSK